ncbi:MAG TPA: signal peptidase II [Mycobacteriales bacterium]|nr:signal peptidase II [Mycobacteriales bacterium]
MPDLQAAGEPPLTDASPVLRRPRRVGVLVSTAVSVFCADLATKTWVVHHFADGHRTVVVPNVLDIQESRNAGAAFGLAAGATLLFSIVALLVIGYIVRIAPRLRSRPWAVALGLLLGGAVGNLGDRIFRSPGVLRGQVVDWIHLHHWPVFNLADSGIVIGGIVAVLLATRGLRADGTREPTGREQP